MKLSTLSSSLLIIISLSVSACQQSTRKIEQIYSSTQCGTLAESIRLISKQADIKSLAAAARQLNKDHYMDVLKSVNYSSNIAILITAGQKSTAGYNYKLQSDHAQLQDNTLALPISLAQPEAGLITAQVITTPCTIISMPNAGLEKFAQSNYKIVLSEE